jgi:hypothetical protein
MGRWRPTLLHKLVRIVEHRAFEVPVALSALSRYRPAELRLRHATPPPVRASDAPLYSVLFSRYPEARLEAVRLDSASPMPAARRFVEEQMRLMQEGGGMDEAAAFRQVEAKMRRQLERAGDARAGRGTLLSQLQDEEEGVLGGALRQQRRREQQALAQLSMRLQRRQQRLQRVRQQQQEERQEGGVEGVGAAAATARPRS